MVKYPSDEDVVRISQARNRLPPLVRVSIPFPPTVTTDNLPPEGQLPLEEHKMYLLCPPLPVHHIIDLSAAAIGEVSVVPKGQPRIVRNSMSLLWRKLPPPRWTSGFKDTAHALDPFLADTTMIVIPKINYWLKRFTDFTT